MNILIVFYFFVYIYGFGYILTRSFKNVDLEIIVIRLAIGLAFFPILGILFNLLHIPLDWRIFLILALSVPLYDFTARKKQGIPLFTIPKLEIHDVILLTFFLINTLIYCNGAFSYPWLEDDDSWNHAASIKYIAVEKTISAPPGFFQYLNPYPPAYDFIMAMLHQTNFSIYWTLKFFNAFIIALGFLFFYYFIKELTQNKNKALWATFFLTTIPCYLSHFIWAHSLIITLFFPAFYCLLKAEKDKRFIFLGAITVAAVFITQPTKSIKFLILVFLMWLALSLSKRKLQRPVPLIIMLGMLISLLWWGPVIANVVKGNFVVAYQSSIQHYGPPKETVSKLLQQFTDPHSGTATRAYNLKDYFLGPQYNMINSPVGVGPIVSLLGIWGIVISLIALLKPKKQPEHTENDNHPYHAVMLLWFIFIFLAMNSVTFHLPVGLFAFRFWTLFAIPMAFLAAEATYEIGKFFKNRRLKVITLSSIMVTVILTSGLEKFDINMALWPWGVDYKSFGEVRGYVWLRKHLPPDTKVFTFTKNLLVIGNDMYADYWHKEYQEAFKDAMQMDVISLHRALKRQKFEYIVIGQKEIRKFSSEAVNTKLKIILDSKLFEPTFGNSSVNIFKIL